MKRIPTIPDPPNIARTIVIMISLTVISIASYIASASLSREPFPPSSHSVTLNKKSYIFSLQTKKSPKALSFVLLFFYDFNTGDGL